MADVVRFVREFQEITYTVGPDSVKRAICTWLYDEHNGVFDETTKVRFCAGGSIAVTTRYDSPTPSPTNTQEGAA